MDRYFFHVHYGEYTEDLDGTLLPGLEAARTAAVSLLGELLRDQAADFWDRPEISVTVADADGQVLWVIETAGRASAAVESRTG